jgi:hypothetical protein
MMNTVRPMSKSLNRRDFPKAAALAYGYAEAATAGYAAGPAEAALAHGYAGAAGSAEAAAKVHFA